MWDRDFDGNNDLMDRFALNIIAQSTSSLSAETTFLGVTSGTMTISFTIACDANYYGLLCNVFCIAQNSAQFGYYTCNPSDGSRVCTSDYTGSECKTREFLVQYLINTVLSKPFDVLDSKFDKGTSYIPALTDIPFYGRRFSLLVLGVATPLFRWQQDFNKNSGENSVNG